MSEKQRYPWLDAIRSLAIYLMVIFHLSYDLTLFGHTSFDFQGDAFWVWFPCVIVFLFLLSVGASLRLSHFPQIRFPSFWRRVLKIALAAAMVSLFTRFAFPNGWIYFGTLHNIAFNSILALPFIARPKLALTCCIAIIAIDFFGFEWPWIALDHASMDYIPPMPWFAWVLLGIFLQANHCFQKPFPKARVFQWLIWPGQHSLVIYLTHQIVLYALVWAYTILTKQG